MREVVGMMEGAYSPGRPAANEKAGAKISDFRASLILLLSVKNQLLSVLRRPGVQGR